MKFSCSVTELTLYCACTLSDDTTALEKAVPADKLRAMLQTQLEYYFSAWVVFFRVICQYLMKI